VTNSIDFCRSWPPDLYAPSNHVPCTTNVLPRESAMSLQSATQIDSHVAEPLSKLLCGVDGDLYTFCHAASWEADSGTVGRPSWVVRHYADCTHVKSTFIPRDAMHSADYAVARCLSVRLFVTRWYSVETAKHTLKFFIHTILVFPYHTVWQHSDGDPLSEASNAVGMKTSRFSINTSLYLGNDTK